MNAELAVVYLSGAIDQAPDLGQGWRERIAEFLSAHGCAVADPRQMQKTVAGLDVPALLALRVTDEERFKAHTRRLIDYELDFVARRTTCVIASVDEYARMGTYAELTVAFLHGIPILILCTDRARLSGWTASCAYAIFERFDELIEWLSREATFAPSLSVRLLQLRNAMRGRQTT